ncbi:MAG: hypothetical protein ABI863_04305 [Ginsengibacter sp.]
MEEKPLSGEESIQLITRMISQAKNYYYESGLSALLWGFTNVICFVLAWLSEIKAVNLPFNPFYLMGVTFILQFYYDRKEAKFKGTKSYLDDVHTYVWSAFGICVLILTIVGAIANIGYIVLPLLLLFFGMPTFISGCISKFKPFIIGGIFCWILSIISFLYKSNETFLMVAAGAGVAWIIPGFILRARFYKNIANRKDGL